MHPQLWCVPRLPIFPMRNVKPAKAVKAEPEKNVLPSRPFPLLKCAVLEKSKYADIIFIITRV